MNSSKCIEEEMRKFKEENPNAMELFEHLLQLDYTKQTFEEEVNKQFKKLRKYYTERIVRFGGVTQAEIVERWSCYGAIDTIDSCILILDGGDPMLDEFIEITLSEWEPGALKEHDAALL